MLEIILSLTTVSFLLIISGFFITLKQYKEIKNIKTILTTKEENEKTPSENSIPLQLDLSVLNNLLASGINKGSNTSKENCESNKTK
ncbi:hypothetical protein A6279_15135 [Bacillus wiedmannii]|uniref:Uncharacterized protein n=2 Tax=Bacillus cereus group TaxID=86661 RepID=A0A1D3P285_9BACI|nr:hypothetical protein [Bacillus wiedmannii]EJQ53097.1 hypothetical protein IEI_02085 [Bacillus wiedmannii]KMP29508.1 hypothetical protein TU50_10050 [Bacillus wiedmannii]KXY01925.1 hypothetical protein AT260_26845 [Bacillus wiedmannii]MED2841110.1 hypothetical protein [Bacillus wiedmannii]OAJ99250.1 hypothetical protein A6279_15135 [Bacillus wiedmannii]